MKEKTVKRAASLLLAGMMLCGTASPVLAEGDQGAPSAAVMTLEGQQPEAPETEPTAAPASEPTEAPAAEPTQEPAAEPTAAPTAEPTEAPAAEPTQEPAAEPTAAPTAEPTEAPAAEPTQEPAAEPATAPTAEPTEAPAPAEGEPEGGPALMADEIIVVNAHKYWNDNQAPHAGTLAVHVQGKTANSTTDTEILLSEDNNWTENLDTLPKFDNTGAPYTYTLTDQETYTMAEGAALDTDLENYYTVISEPVQETDGSLSLTIINTLETDFAATKVWNDYDNAYGTRPELDPADPAAASYRACLTLYSRVGDAALQQVAAGDATAENLKITDNGDDTWAFRVVNLPAYDSNNTPIEYVIVEGEVPLSAGNPDNMPFADSFYEARYENTINFSTITDALYTGGTLVNTLAKNDSFTLDKVWQDDGKPETVAGRPTGTLFLYRYVEGIGSYRTASPVQDMSTGLRTTDDTYTFGETEGAGTLPQYDTEGRKYIYYVKEVYDAADAEGHAFNGYEKYNNKPVNGDAANADEKQLTLNGGTLFNRRTGTVTKSLQKTFKAAAIQGHTFAATMQLQRYADPTDDGVENGAWQNVEGKAETLEGFTAEVMTKTASFTVPQFDELGLPITYRVVETGITIDAYTAENPAGYSSGEVADVGADALNSKDPHGYQIRVDVDEESGSITNTLVAQVDVVVNKVWADGKDHSADTVHVRVTGSDDSRYPVDAEGNFVPLEITGSGTARVDNLPRYDAEGKEITYRVEEIDVPAGYAATYSYTYSANCIGDTAPADGVHNYTRTATITNAPVGTGTWIHVQKQWLDDGDADHRGPVAVGVYDAAGRLLTYQTADGQSREAVGTLTADTDWEGDIRISTQNDAPTAELTVREIAITRSAEYGTLYENAQAKTALDRIAAAGVYDYYFAAGGQYPLTDGAYTRDATGCYLYGVTVTDQHVYATKVTRTDAEGKNYNIKNVRVGNVVFNFDKTWVDGNNESGLRPETLEVNVSRSGAVQAAVTLNDKNDWSGTTWDAAGDKTFLPKYDQYGALYAYTVSETAKNGETVVDLGERDYVGSSTGKYTVGNAENAHTSDLYEYQFTNKKSSSVTPVFYKLWLDDAEDVTHRRPDVSVTLYRSVKADNGDWEAPVEITDYIDHDWTTKYSNYDWAVVFDSMPKYDGEGREYTYYVKEAMAQNNTGYVDHYYPGNMAGEGEAHHWTTTGTPTLDKAYLGEEIADDNDTASFAGFIKINGTVVNRREDTRRIQGKKIWSGLNTAWPTASLKSLLAVCPEVALTLYRHNADGAPDAPVKESERLAQAETGLLSRIGNALAGLFAPRAAAEANVTATVSGTNTSYDMGTFAKYDTNGQLIEYYVLESKVIEDDPDHTLDQAYEGAFEFSKDSVNAFAITNVYTGGTGIVLEVDKTFDFELDAEGEKTAEGESLPDIEFTLDAAMPLRSGALQSLGTISSKDPNVDVTWEKNGDGWIILFNNLKKYAPNLQEIKYTLKETKVNGYVVDTGAHADDVIMGGEGVEVVFDDSGKGRQPVVNEYNGGEALTAEVEKTWDYGALAGTLTDAEKKAYEQPVIFTLNRQSPGDPVQTVGSITLDGAVDASEPTPWHATWSGLATYAPDGETYTYSVVETAPEGSPVGTIWKMSGTTTLNKNGTALSAAAKNTFNTLAVKPQKTWALDGRNPAQDRDIVLLFVLHALPESIPFTLYRDGAAYPSAAAPETQSLKVNTTVATVGTAVTVPAYDTAGKAYAYTWQETLDGYPVIKAEAPTAVTVADGISATENTIPVKLLTITKNWADESNRDGLRPASVSFTVIRDGLDAAESQKETVTLTAADKKGDDNTWATEVYVPVYKNADTDKTQYSSYDITEAAIEAARGYIATEDKTGLVNSDEATALTYSATNTHAVNNSLTITAEKTWSYTPAYADLDADPLPAQQTFTLVAKVGGTTPADLYSQIETAAGAGFSWSLTGDFTAPAAPAAWANLPAFYQNTAVGTAAAITYTVQEAAIPGWSAAGSSYTGKAAETVGAIRVTNTRALETLKVNKIWEDFDNSYNTRPASITFKVEYSARTLAGESWPDWSENWQVLKAGAAAKTLTINKAADNANNQSVTLENLPVYSLDGKTEYRYRAVEQVQNADLGDYTAGDPVQNSKTECTITNTMVCTSLTAVKTWQDADNAHGLRPASITFAVQQKAGAADYADYKPDGATLLTFTAAVGADGALTGGIENLPRYTKDGAPCSYRAVEQSFTPAGSSMPVTRSGNIIGAYTAAEGDTEGDPAAGFTTPVTNTLETGSLRVTKTWADDDDRDGARPGSVTVALTNDKGLAMPEELTLNSGNGWAAGWAGLPLRDKTGAVIHYTVTENPIANYNNIQHSINGGTPTAGSAAVTALNAAAAVEIGFTNTRAPQTTGIKAIKLWEDQDDAYGERPDQIELTLYASYNGGTPAKVLTDEAGAEITNPVTVKADKTGSWETTWLNLPVYQHGEVGAKLTYSVQETAVGGYDPTGNGTLRITNVQTTTELAVNKTWAADPLFDDSGVESVTFALQHSTNGTDWQNVEKNGAKVTVIAAKAGEESTARFTGLPTHSKDGVEYAYRAVETAITVAGAPITAVPAADAAAGTVGGYTYTSATLPAAAPAKGYVTTITNSITATAVRAQKVWVGDCTHPAAATFALYADGSDAGRPKTVQADGWEARWTGLPLYRDAAASAAIAYTVRETQVDGYLAPQITGSMAEGFTVTNTATGFTLNKVDATNGAAADKPALAGAQFTLSGKFAGTAETTLTLLDGSTESTATLAGKLIVGERYTLHESKAPQNYAPGADVSFTLGTEGSYTATVENTRKTGSVTVKKLDALNHDTTLAGAAFTLQNTVTGESFTKETDENGVVVFSGLYYGDAYTLKESATLDTYLLSGEEAAFTLSDAQPNMSYNSWENAPTEFRFKKVQKTGDPLPGATFSLFEGETQLDTALSDAEGIVTFRYFVKGKTYTIKETAAPKGYFLNETAYRLVVDAEGSAAMLDGDDTVEEVVNEDMGSITLTKTDAKDAGILLAGAQFELKDADGTLVKTETTDETGKLTFAELPMGSYTITETKAPAGYVLGTDTTKVTLAKGTATQNVSLSRTNGKANFAINKMVNYLESCYHEGKTTAALAGAGFTLYEDAACTKAAAAAASDAEGRVCFEDIAVGTWYLKETSVPAGRGGILLSDTVYTVRVDALGGVTIDGTAGDTTIVNDVARGDIVLLKVNESDPEEVLPGSTYGLYRKLADEDVLKRTAGGKAALPDALLEVFADAAAAEVPVAQATTDQNGVLRFDGVLTGVEYTIRELIAPEGSEVSEKPIKITFTVDAKTGKAKITKFEDGSGTAKVDKDGSITWYEPPTKAEFAKVDTAGSLLAGATLRITNADGTRVKGVEDWVSSAESTHRIDGVLVGGKSYILQELSAPDGYELAAPIPFTMSTKKVAPKENYVQSWRMVDEKTSSADPETTTPTPTPQAAAGAIPQTGDPFEPLLPVVLMGLSAIGLAYVVLKKRRQ